MRLARLSLFFLFFIGSFSLAFSQGDGTTCEQTLNVASAEFEAGRFYGLPALLKGCLEGGFTKEQKFRAYYVLTQAYLILDDPIAAEDSYLRLLTIDPEFRPNPKTDPIDLVYLSTKFTSRPRFTPHFPGIGGNVSFPKSIYGISTYSSEVSTLPEIQAGFQIGGGMDWNINDNWSIGAEGSFSTKSFIIPTLKIAKDDNSTVIDKSSWIDVPLYVKYSYDSGQWRPFAYVGFALNVLLSSKSTLVFNDNSNPSPGITRIAQGADVDFTFTRRSLNQSLLFGGGVKYKLGKNFLYADVRYMMGLNNVVIPEKNYYNPDGTLATSVTTYQYVSDFFRLDNLALSAGYIVPFYDPRKIKKVNAKGFFRKLFKPKAKKG
jgi:hypothetical protein